MFRKGKIPALLYEFLRKHPRQPFSVRMLTECLKEAYRSDIKYSTVKRELSRLARKGFISRIKRGMYSYVPLSDDEYVDRVKALQIADEVRKILSNYLAYNIPPTPKNQRIICRKIQEIIADLSYLRFYQE